MCVQWVCERLGVCAYNGYARRLEIHAYNDYAGEIGELYVYDGHKREIGRLRNACIQRARQAHIYMSMHQVVGIQRPKTTNNTKRRLPHSLAHKRHRG